MKSRNNISLSVFLFLFGTIFIVLPFISSCGKASTTNATTLNIQYQVLNLSPDLGSVDLYIDFRKVNSYSYFYPTSSGYFYLTSIDTPLQIRPGTGLTNVTVIQTSNILSLDNILKANLKYSVFIVGFKNSLSGADSVDKIFTTDTASLPALGRGKIRFLNASPRSQGIDVLMNGFAPSAFTNVKYKSVSKYIEVPAGNYDIQLFPHSSSTVLQDIRNETIQDGRLYTLYCYGLAGHTDSLAFGTGTITNK
ncbi:MAG: DUF4397 domain-containing protein [Mucilaginibacter sp.]